MKSIPTVTYAGVIGAFVKGILTELTYTNNDGQLATWTLLPAIVAASPDATEERRRAKALAWAAYRLLGKALRENGDSNHAAMLDDAVERGEAHPLTHSEWMPPDGATGRVMAYLRLKYHGNPLNDMISAAFWMAVAWDKRDRGGNDRYANNPREAAEQAGKVFAAWRGYVGDKVYEAARLAIVEALSDVVPVANGIGVVKV
jgi:hypothetical protein